MPNPNITEVSKGTQWKPGQSGNLKGVPKGTKHLTTWIQDMLNDEKFTTMMLDGYELKKYKGAPLKAILAVQVNLALNSKDENVRIKATELLMKHGWNAKAEVDITSNGNEIGQALTSEQAQQLLELRAKRDSPDK